MNKIIKIIFCLMLSFLPQQMFSYGSPQVKELNKLIAIHSKILSKRHNMWQIGTGVGTPNGIINMLSVSFQRDKISSIEEGRKILIDCGNELLKAVNSNEKLRPHLVKYPLTINNIQVRLFLCDQKFDANNNQLEVISLINGELSFCYVNKINKNKYSKEENETYEEAVKKLQSSNPNSI